MVTSVPAHRATRRAPASEEKSGHALRLTEKQFSQQVVDLAKMLGWRIYRTWLPIHSPAGFPDLVLLKPPRLIFAELESEKGQTTPKQDEWLEDLRAASTRQDHCGMPEHVGFDVFLWRPDDLDAIARILGGRDVPR